MPKYPKIVVGTQNVSDAIHMEGRVHGLMKQRFLPKSERQAFTREMHMCQTWDKILEVVGQWVTICKHENVVDGWCRDCKRRIKPIRYKGDGEHRYR